MEAILIIIGGIVILPALIIYNGISWGYVMMKLWYWFLLPVFPFMPHVGFWQCVGLFTFLTVFRGQHTGYTIKEEYRESGSPLATAIMAPWLTLLCAFLIYQFTK